MHATCLCPRAWSLCIVYCTVVWDPRVPCCAVPCRAVMCCGDTEMLMPCGDHTYVVIDRWMDGLLPMIGGAMGEACAPKHKGGVRGTVGAKRTGAPHSTGFDA